MTNGFQDNDIWSVPFALTEIWEYFVCAFKSSFYVSIYGFYVLEIFITLCLWASRLKGGYLSFGDLINYHTIIPTCSICLLWQNYKGTEFINGCSSSLQEKEISPCPAHAPHNGFKFAYVAYLAYVAYAPTLIFFIKAPANEKLSSRENLWISIFPIKILTRLDALTTLFTDAKAICAFEKPKVP